jgi:3-methyladenine DNA glycosylase AlkD
MPDQPADLVRLVRQRLAAAADDERAPQMQAYMKSSMPYRGVSAVPLRAITKKVLDEHPLPSRDAWVSCVRELWDTAEYREERYAALIVASHRLYRSYQDPAALPLYRHMVLSGAWWDLVDPVATRSVGGILLDHRDDVSPVIRDWSVDDNLWLRRTAILSQLHHKEHTDLALLSDVIEANLEGTRHGREFFVRKAIGWALRQHARVDPGWVRAFVTAHEDRLSGLSRREARKHV